MSLKTLKAALSEAKPDQFADGTVIRWQSAGRYTYAAIKTPAGWFTTATDVNRHVKQVLNFQELLEVLQRSETSDVVVAVAWANPLDDEDAPYVLQRGFSVPREDLEGWTPRAVDVQHSALQDGVVMPGSDQMPDLHPRDSES